MTRICIIQGHPTSGEEHFCHALARAYAEGAAKAGHEVKTIIVADLDFPILRSKQDWDSGQAPPAITAAQDAIRWAQHLLDHPSLMDWIDAGLVEGFLRAGSAARFRYVDGAQG